MKLHYKKYIGLLEKRAAQERANPDGQKLYITSKEFYEIYKNDGGYKKYDTFFRELRYIIEKARRKGVKIIGDNNGFRIAQTSDEWNRYIEKKKTALISEIETLATCSNRTPASFVRELFYNKPAKDVSPSLDLFGGA